LNVDKFKNSVIKVTELAKTYNEGILKDYNEIREKLNSGVGSVAEFIVFLTNSIETRRNDRDQTFLYRGEPKSYDTPFLPTLLRKSESNIAKLEIKNVRRFQNSKSGRELEQYYKHLECKEDLSWWFLAQHFSTDGEPYYKTRLLDITKNSLIGLYFACKDYDNDDGWVHVFYYGNIQFRRPNKDYKTWSEHIIDSKNYYRKSIFYKFDSKDYRPENVAYPKLDKQAGLFFFVKEDFSERFPLFFSIKINKDAKPKIRKKLAQMGIDKTIEE